MGLEAAQFISQLDTGNPSGSDAYSTADDHLRLLKSVLKSQFPALGTAPVAATAAELGKLSGFGSGNIESTARKNQADGYAGLGSDGKIPDNLVKLGNVSQHQAALQINWEQLQNVPGTFADTFAIKPSNETRNTVATPEIDTQLRIPSTAGTWEYEANLVFDGGLGGAWVLVRESSNSSFEGMVTLIGANNSVPLGLGVAGFPLSYDFGLQPIGAFGNFLHFRGIVYLTGNGFLEVGWSPRFTGNLTMRKGSFLRTRKLA
jgi:hypothetical protein